MYIHDSKYVQLPWIEIQPAVSLPVFADVVSNTMPEMLSAQFHSSARDTVAEDMRLPALSEDLTGRAGTPSSFTPPTPK